jgi:hypothetical protein
LEKHIGRINGYPADRIQKIITKHEEKTRIQNLTTLNSSSNQTKKRISVPFFPTLTNRFKKIFKRHNIDLVTTSSNYKIKNQLISTKDVRKEHEKAGIYEIKCGTRNCNYKYIGQTKRSITTRFKEHKSHTNNNHTTLSSVANHMKNKILGGRRICEHQFDITNLKLLKNVTNERKLDSYESILLFKNRKKKLMNDEQQIAGNIKSPLFKLLDEHQSNH